MAIGHAARGLSTLLVGTELSQIICFAQLLFLLAGQQEGNPA